MVTTILSSDNSIAYLSVLVEVKNLYVQDFTGRLKVNLGGSMFLSLVVLT